MKIEILLTEFFKVIIIVTHLCSWCHTLSAVIFIGLHVSEEGRSVQRYERLGL